MLFACLSFTLVILIYVLFYLILFFNLLTYRLQSYWWNSSPGAQHREFQTDSKSHQTVGQTWVVACVLALHCTLWNMSQLVLCENKPHRDLKWPVVFVGIFAVNEKQHCSIVPQEIRLACISCLATSTCSCLHFIEKQSILDFHLAFRNA